MRFSSFKKIVYCLPLSIIVALLFAVMIVAPVSAASAKGTRAATSSARTVIVAPTAPKIKTVPEKSADYGPNGALYDSCSGDTCYNYHDDGYRAFHFDGSNQVQWSQFNYYE